MALPSAKFKISQKDNVIRKYKSGKCFVMVYNDRATQTIVSDYSQMLV